jgi:tripartite-type tricarboxylate transporter receptor subunit TctC
MRTPLAAALLAALLSAGSAAAQPFSPTKPIKIIIPVPVGSAPDMLSRIIGAGFQAKWGHPAIVDPKPGASQNIAAEALFRADPDGYTLLTAPPPALAINEYLFPRLAFDPKAFTPVTVLVEVPNVLVTRVGLEVKTTADLIALAKAKPGALNYGSTGVGGTPHLTSEAFNFRAGVKIVHVPYKGTVEILNDLFGERIDIGFLNLLDVVAHVEAGKLKALAVTSAERSAAFPDVPTMKDTIPDFIATTWFANIAPPKTPEPIARAISDTIREAFQTPEAKRIIGGLKGARTVLSTPAEAAAYIRADSLRWKDVIEKNGIKAE